MAISPVYYLYLNTEAHKYVHCLIEHSLFILPKRYIIENDENNMFMSLFSPYLYSYTQMCTPPLISQDIHRFCLVYTTTCTFSTYYMNVVRITLFLFSYYGLVISNNVKSYKNLSCHLMLYRQLHFNSFNVFLVQYWQYLFFISEFDYLPF